MAKGMAKTHKFIQNRNGRYHIRVPVPKDIQSELGRKEITKSFKTKDKKQAEKLYPDYLKEIQLTFEQAEATFNGRYLKLLLYSGL